MMIARARNWYARFERPISSISLVGGFMFDALALRRVDEFWENFWVIIHLLVVAVFIVLLDREENEGMNVKDPAQAHFWFVNILQFTFGGLLSTFLVFYFRSGTFWVSWPFFLILTVAFVANESFKRHYARLDFQISLFFLSLFSFMIFLVPVVLHAIGPGMFLLSGAASLCVLMSFLVLLGIFAKEKFRRGGKTLFVSIAAIFIAMNVLYFLNLIPPIPLSLKDAGMYHSLVRNTAGDYVVQGEDTGGWLSYFSPQEDFHASSYDTVYAYTAIFSPTSLNTDIVHEWQRYDRTAGAWITVSRIDLSLIGGREGGYRTYSTKTGITQGEWRVNIMTPRGEVLGRVPFTVTFVDTAPALTTSIKN